jgi:hypothetical protein
MYARVIGIYHANIIYIGEGNIDYQPHRLEFVWVRWYRVSKRNTTSSWRSRRLDRLEFLPINHEKAFGFINPSDILRATHIVPIYCRDQVYNGRSYSGVSFWAQDGKDWNEYVVNR